MDHGTILIATTLCHAQCRNVYSSIPLNVFNIHAHKETSRTHYWIRLPLRFVPLADNGIDEQPPKDNLRSDD